jgi:hypothetical protein
VVRWISRVNIDTIRFKSVLPSPFDSSSIALQTIPLSDIQRHRFRCPPPLVASLPDETVEQSFEYEQRCPEYEYRCPEYEYDCLDEQKIGGR